MDETKPKYQTKCLKSAKDLALLQKMRDRHMLAMLKYERMDKERYGLWAPTRDPQTKEKVYTIQCHRMPSQVIMSVDEETGNVIRHY